MRKKAWFLLNTLFTSFKGIETTVTWVRNCRWFLPGMRSWHGGSTGCSLEAWGGLKSRSFPVHCLQMLQDYVKSIQLVSWNGNKYDHDIPAAAKLSDSRSASKRASNSSSATSGHASFLKPRDHFCVFFWPTTLRLTKKVQTGSLSEWFWAALR